MPTAFQIAVFVVGAILAMLGLAQRLADYKNPRAAFALLVASVLWGMALLFVILPPALAGSLIGTGLIAGSWVMRNHPTVKRIWIGSTVLGGILLASNGTWGVIQLLRANPQGEVKEGPTVAKKEPPPPPVGKTEQPPSTPPAAPPKKETKSATAKKDSKPCPNGGGIVITGVTRGTLTNATSVNSGGDGICIADSPDLKLNDIHSYNSNLNSPGPISAGPCSVIQVGGDHNQATGGNCGPPETIRSLEIVVDIDFPTTPQAIEETGKSIGVESVVAFFDQSKKRYRFVTDYSFVDWQRQERVHRLGFTYTPETKPEILGHPIALLATFNTLGLDYSQFLMLSGMANRMVDGTAQINVVFLLNDVEIFRHSDRLPTAQLRSNGTRLLQVPQLLNVEETYKAKRDAVGGLPK